MRWTAATTEAFVLHVDNDRLIHNREMIGQMNNLIFFFLKRLSFFELEVCNYLLYDIIWPSAVGHA